VYAEMERSLSYINSAAYIWIQRSGNKNCWKRTGSVMVGCLNWINPWIIGSEKGK